MQYTLRYAPNTDYAVLWLFKFLKDKDYTFKNEDRIFYELPLHCSSSLDSYFEDNNDSWCEFAYDHMHKILALITSFEHAFVGDADNMYDGDCGVDLYHITHEVFSKVDVIYEMFNSSDNVPGWDTFIDLYSRAYDYMDKLHHCTEYLETDTLLDKYGYVVGVILSAHTPFWNLESVYALYYIYKCINTLNKAVEHACSTFAGNLFN